MEVKFKIFLKLLLVLIFVSCTTPQSGNNDEDFASQDESANSDSAAAAADAPSDAVADNSADSSADSSANSNSGADELSIDNSKDNSQENQTAQSATNSEQNSENQKLNDEFQEQTQNEQSLNDQSPQDTAQASQDSLQQNTELMQQEEQPQVLSDSEQKLSEPINEEPQKDIVAKDNSANVVEIKNIQFKTSETGGSLIIDASGPFTYTTRKNDSLQQLIIEIPNSHLPKKLTRPFVMKEIKGGVASVDAYQNPGTKISRFVLQLRSNVKDPFIQLEGNSLVVYNNDSAVPTNNVVDTEKLKEFSKEGAVNNSVETSRNQEESSTGSDIAEIQTKSTDILTSLNLEDFIRTNSVFKGEKINCLFIDMELDEVIKMIAYAAEINMILDDDIPKTKVNISIDQVPWDQCLTVIMKSKKLGYTRYGNIIRITTLDILNKEDEDLIKRMNSRKQIEPMKFRIFPINYANGPDLQTQISVFLSKENEKSGAPTDGSRNGKISFDARTNSLIVLENQENLEKIAVLIKSLDTAPSQVLIEGKIVEASESFQKQLGINWGFGGQPIRLGSNSKAPDFTPNFSLGKPNTTPEFGFGFNVGIIDVIGNLTATLNLLEKEDMVKVLSSPRVVSMNNTNAKINATTTVSSANLDKDGKVSEGKSQDYEITLDVTPQITNEASVKMKINVARSYGGTAPNAALAGAAAKYKRDVKTEVLVKNGQTSVIGGVFQNDTAEAEVGISGLKDIPILGYLFRQKNTLRTKTELLIFLTPRILTYNDISDLGKDSKQ